ncbi:MAG: hypothetical protein NW224_17440 [Leptolyngbyaceae cyanobacterium bins.302]|nr:hypothetical protein [Leptolyngbyaceae cyanobacterium bins.302]
MMMFSLMEGVRSGDYCIKQHAFSWDAWKCCDRLSLHIILSPILG